jgi:hypothetical protein
MRASHATLALMLFAIGPARAGQASAPPRAVTPAAIPITSWATLGNDPAKPSLIRAPTNRYAPRADDATESITVFGRRGRTRDQQWRDDIAAAQPVYEAEHSASAQHLYAAEPVWGSPEEQRWTSVVKDTLGVCGLPVPGAQIDCPNLR